MPVAVQGQRPRARSAPSAAAPGTAQPLEPRQATCMYVCAGGTACTSRTLPKPSPEPPAFHALCRELTCLGPSRSPPVQRSSCQPSHPWVRWVRHRTWRVWAHMSQAGASAGPIPTVTVKDGQQAQEPASGHGCAGSMGGRDRTCDPSHTRGLTCKWVLLEGDTFVVGAHQHHPGQRPSLSA